MSATPAFLATERLILRPFNVEILQRGSNYLQWLNDPEVCAQNRHQRFPYTQEQAARYLQSMNSNRDVVLAVCLRDTDRHIGNIAIQAVDWVVRQGELALLFGERDCWGRGYATEAAQMLGAHAFLKLNLQRLYCATTQDNTAMQKVAAKMGFTLEGRRRRAAFAYGSYVDVMEFGLLREEWEQRMAARLKEGSGS
jgi:[ribosomal protein S5]-alanine N-acetyltransferase